MKHIVVEDNVFRSIVHVFVNCPLSKLIKWADKTHDIVVEQEPGADGVFVKLISKTGASVYCIWIEEFEWRVSQQGFFAHELIHCTKTILDDCGIPINTSTEEVLAYYYAYLFQEVYKKLNRS